MNHVLAVPAGAAIFWFLCGPAAIAQNNNEGAARSYCRQPDQAILVLLDRTTAYDQLDNKTLELGLDATVSGLDVGNRIIVRTITDDPFRAAEIFDGCMPGCKHDTWWEPAICNGFRAKQQQAEFHGLVADSVRWIPERSEAYSHSAIFATIAAVSQDYRDARVRRLVIFSDLLENSSYASTKAVLQEHPDRIVKRLVSSGIIPWVRNVTVTIYGVGRSDAPDRHGLTFGERKNLEAAWTDWFKAGGAKSVQIYQWYPNLR